MNKLVHKLKQTALTGLAAGTLLTSSGCLTARDTLLNVKPSPNYIYSNPPGKTVTIKDKDTNEIIGTYITNFEFHAPTKSRSYSVECDGETQYLYSNNNGAGAYYSNFTNPIGTMVDLANEKHLSLTPQHIVFHFPEEIDYSKYTKEEILSDLKKLKELTEKGLKQEIYLKYEKATFNHLKQRESNNRK